MNQSKLKEAVSALQKYYKNAEKAEKIVTDCALIAAAANTVGCIIPVVSVPALIVGCFGAVWVMYAKVCKELGINLKENVLKLMARAALSNIAANLGSVMLASFFGMLFPGTSAIFAAVVTYSTVYLAGIIFLLTLRKLAEQSNDLISFSDISEDKITEPVKVARITKEDLNAAKAAYEASNA